MSQNVLSKWIKKQFQIDAQRYADEQNALRQKKIQFFDILVFRPQLQKAISQMPPHFNFSESALQMVAEPHNYTFSYRIAKKDISKKMSLCVSDEIQTALNDALKQNRFECFYNLYQHYVSSITNVEQLLCEATLRPDYETPTVQTALNHQIIIIKQSYKSVYDKLAPFVYMLEVDIVFDNINFIELDVRIINEADVNRLHPSTLPF